MSGLLSQAAKLCLAHSSAGRFFQAEPVPRWEIETSGGGVQTESWPDAQTGLARWETVLASPGAEPDMLVCHMVFWVEK